MLRYYNDIGLFTPDRIDSETGYRYYSVRQLSQLNRVLALKELGLSLDQVKRLLKEEVSASEIRGMLTLKKAQIEQTIQAEAARLRAVESRLTQSRTLSAHTTPRSATGPVQCMPQKHELEHRRLNQRPLLCESAKQALAPLLRALKPMTPKPTKLLILQPAIRCLAS